jgi:GT2 family glycosyltransferase
MPGPETHESDFSIGFVDSEEKCLSAYLLLDEGTLQARIVPSGTSLPFSIRDVVLNRVSRLEILAAAVFRFIVGHNASSRLPLRAMFLQVLAIFRAGGFPELRIRLGRFVESQVDRRDNYRFWVLQNTPQEAELNELRAKCTRLPYKPVFSLLVPISDPDGQSLRRCIRSIASQVYPLWELCLVMPDVAPYPVETLLEEFRDVSPRIKVLYGNRQKQAFDIESRVTGDFICTVHSDAVLAPEALGEYALFLSNHPDADALYSDEDRIDAQNNRFQPFFKPDWSPEYLESFPYISSLTCYRTSIVRKTSWLKETDKLAIDYDLALRFSELTQKIAHIPKVLYHRYVMEDEGSGHTGNAVDCLKGHFQRVGIGGTVTESPYPGLLDVRYEIAKNPLVSIIIPAGGRKAKIRGVNTDLLSNCITSLCNKSVYKNYEIIVVHDNNLDRSTLRLIKDSKGKLVPFRDKFNFSAKINLGARHAQGEHLLILNDDTEVISAEWLSAMLEFSQRKAIGVVGAKLYFEDGTIQHAGVTFTRDGFPHHIYHGHPDSLPGYFYSLVASRNCLAVTGACLMTRTEVFHEVGGFNEEIAVNYNDVDYCFKVIEAGYRIIFTPRAKLFHFESKSRLNTVEQREMDHFERLWHSRISLDPYYNVNLEPNPSFFEVKVRP